MQQMMIRILLLLMATPLICYTEGIPNSIRSEALLDQTAFQSNEQIKSNQESILSNPLVITLIVLLAFNLFVLILVYGCRRCLRLPFQVNEAEAREHFGLRYPNLKFESHSKCLTDGQSFYGRDCYENSQVIGQLPAFIYGREFDAEISHLDYFTIRQCQRCGGLTKTLQVFKYGKLRQCWQTLFMILISPCFLAFTIHRITANSILWRKFFCTQCGFQKPVQK